KSADAGIGAGAAFVVGRQLALRVQADFIEHAAEKHQAANLLGGMSETGDFHGGGSMNARVRWQTGRGGAGIEVIVADEGGGRTACKVIDSTVAAPFVHNGLAMIGHSSRDATSPVSSRFGEAISDRGRILRGVGSEIESVTAGGNLYDDVASDVLV